MRENSLKTLWSQGTAATNCWIASDSAYVAEAMASQGWDTLTIDMQHGLIGVTEMHAMLTAVSGYPVTPLVRVPWNEPGEILLTFAMIETKEALGNLEDICGTPGLDALLIGPSDLGLSLGGEPRLNQTNPVVVEAIDTILATARRHNLRTAIVNNTADYSRQMIAKGFDLVTVTSDMGLVRAGIDLVREMKG